MDLLIASSDYPDDQLLTLWHQKAGGSFEDWTPRLGLRWINAAQISLADVDRDGATDILVATSNTRLKAEQLKDRSLDVGVLRNMEPARNGNRFLSIRLKGAGKGKSNTDAVGARVTVWTGDLRQTREVYGGLGCGGHRDDGECRFGMGKALKADKIEVRWPDGKSTIQTFTDVATNAFYILEEGKTLKAAK